MNWFYALNGQQQGPVSDSELQGLVQAGTITGSTLVWREGMADWQPLSTAGGAVAAAAVAPGFGICVECGKTFPQDELLQLDNSLVCARCKPIFLQRLSEGAVTPTSGLWRKKKQLVTVTETTLPDRCVKCNAPANGFRLKRTLYWHSPAYLLLLFCNVLIFAIVSLIVRKKAVLYVGMCERHHERRKKGLIIGWGSFGVGLLMLLGGIGAQLGWVAFAGVVLMIAGGITGGVMAYSISAAKITPEHVFVNGCHKDYLANLPEWPGA